MLKKGIIVAAMLASMAGLAVAGGPEVAPALTFNSGWYLGVGASRDDAYFKAKADRTLFETGPPVVNREFVERRNDMGADGWNANFFAGYDWRINDSYNLGFELFADFSTLSATNADNNWDFQNSSVEEIQYRIKAAYTFGFSILPGYQLAPGTLLFARLGYVNGRFKVNSPQFRNAVNFLIGEGANKLSGNSNKSGIEVGLGQRVRVSDHISVSGEYDWNYFGSFSASSVSEGFGSLNQDETMVNRFNASKPQVEAFSLSAVYHFTANGVGPNWQAAPLHAGLQYYVGLVGSRDTAKLELDRYATVLGNFVPNRQQNRNWDNKLRGFDAELLVGSGYSFSNRYYLGVEGFGSFSSMDGDMNENLAQQVPAVVNQTHHDSVDINWTFGVSAMPGFFVTDNTLMYLRVGVVWSQFKIRESQTTTPAIPDISIYNRNNTNSEAGIQVGVGMDTAITQNLSLRTEFDWAKYNSFRTREAAYIPDPQSPGNKDTNQSLIRAVTDRFKVALIYHFYSEQPLTK